MVDNVNRRYKSTGRKKSGPTLPRRRDSSRSTARASQGEGEAADPTPLAAARGRRHDGQGRADPVQRSRLSLPATWPSNLVVHSATSRRGRTEARTAWRISSELPHAVCRSPPPARTRRGRDALTGGHAGAALAGVGTLLPRSRPHSSGSGHMC